MANVKAYAIHRIGARAAGKKVEIPASTKDRPSVFITTEEKLKALVAANAARPATDVEIAVAEKLHTITDTTVAVPEPKKSVVGDEKPASGAAGDPTSGGKKSGKAKAAAEQAAAEQAAAEQAAAEQAKAAAGGEGSGSEGDDI